MFATIFAQSYTTYTTTTTASSSKISLVLVLAYLFFLVCMLISMWKVYTKAGKPGWVAIVPIYNTLVLLEIVGRPWYWLLWLFIPIVNIYFLAVVCNDLAKAFGKGMGMTVLLFLLPFIGYPILGFGPAEYHGGPANMGWNPPQTPANPPVPPAPTTGV